MHPDLAALQARYDELAAGARENHISVDDAASTLNNLTVTDGSGAVWRMDMYGAFLRSEFPGAPAQPADPAGFVDHQMRPDPGLATGTNPDYPFANTTPPAGMVNADDNPWANQPTTRPGGFGASEAPAGNSGFGGGFAGPPSGGFGTPLGGQSGGLGYTEPGYDPAAAPGFQGTDTADLYRPSEERPARSLSDAETPSALAVRLDWAKYQLRRNGIFLAIVLIALGLVAGRVLGGSDDSSTIPTTPQASDTAGTPSTTPSSTSPTAPTTAGTPTPTATAPSTSSTPAPATGAPARKDITATVTALLSGNRNALRTRIAEPDARAIAISAAFFAGLQRSGLDLDLGTLTLLDGTVTGAWRITGPGVDPIDITVTWVKDNGVWKLRTAPLP